MTKNKIHLAKNILLCVATAVAALLLANAIAFLIALTNNGWEGADAARFKHGIFYLNDQATGLTWGEPTTHGFLLLVFLVACIFKYKRGKLSF